MDNSKLVIDTGIFIEFLWAKDKTQTSLLQLSEETVPFISSVTIYELYMGATDEQKQIRYRVFNS